MKKHNFALSVVTALLLVAFCLVSVLTLLHPHSCSGDSCAICQIIGKSAGAAASPDRVFFSIALLFLVGVGVLGDRRHILSRSNSPVDQGVKITS